MSAKPNPSMRTQDFLAFTLKPVEQGFFEMPRAPYTTLLESLMKRWLIISRFSSWASASIALAVGFYIIFVVISVFDRTLFTLDGRERWATLLFPAMMLYLLLATTRLRCLLHHTVLSLRQCAAADSCEKAVVNVYGLSRPLEWLTLALGGGLYGLFGPASTYWHHTTWAISWQEFAGGGIVGSLLGWHIYSWLHRTWSIAQLYDEVRATYHLQEPLILLRPILQWSVGLCLFFLGPIILKIIFLRTLTPGGDFVIYSYGLLVAAQLALLSKVITTLVMPRLQGYLEMPITSSANLVDDLMDTWMSLTGLKSWLTASLVLSITAYIVGIMVTYPNEFLYDHRSGSSWWNRLLYPVLFSYFLIALMLLRHLSEKTIVAFQKFIPASNKRFKQLAQAVYEIDRGHEWLAVTGGIVGYLLLTLALDAESQPAMLYDTFIGSILFGLLGWQVYIGLTQTKRLGQLHSQLNGLNIFGHQVSADPLTRWNIGLGLTFIGAIFLSAIFLPDPIGLIPLTAYSILTSATVLVFVFNKVPTSMLPWFRVFRIIVIFVMVSTVGTFGFYYLENAHQNLTPLDALYMTIVTMTTIGYGDVTPVTPMGRAFTILLSLFAVGISTYAISALASFLVEGDLNEIFWGKQMSKEIAKLQDHIILCGSGRVGLQIANEFYKTNTPFVIVEQDSEAVEELLRTGDIFCVHGDATKDDILLTAGIQRAKGLVTTLSDDKDNAFVVLTARSLNPNPGFRIIARLSDEDNREKMKKAGATEIVSPQAIGGLRMASVMLRPSVVSFLDGMLRAEELTGQTLRLEELRVEDLNVPALIGQERLSIIDIGRHTQLLVVAIRSHNGDYQYKPRGDTTLKSDDLLIVLGTPEEVAHARGF